MRRTAAGSALVAVLACAVTAAAGPGHASAHALRRSSTFEPVGASAAPASTAATWCGSSATADRAPNVVAGNPIHWVYLIPSDGADNLGSVAPVMQGDAEQIDAWWRGQDSTRAPRDDVATFPCATQLDITTVRSSRPGSQLAALDGRFSLIFDTLEQAGLTSQFTKYLVYYDGPSDEDNVCGQGGSNDPNGFGMAVVFYRSCVGISTAAVAAHEFLHTTGAVPDGAPHACTGENSGHTCDSDVDLMYPFIGRNALSAKVLDPGRDDYYGHSGGWTDSQDSAWLVRLDGQAPLALTVAGPDPWTPTCRGSSAPPAAPPRGTRASGSCSRRRRGQAQSSCAGAARAPEAGVLGDASHPVPQSRRSSRRRRSVSRSASRVAGAVRSSGGIRAGRGALRPCRRTSRHA